MIASTGLGGESIILGASLCACPSTPNSNRRDRKKKQGTPVKSSPPMSSQISSRYPDPMPILVTWLSQFNRSSFGFFNSILAFRSMKTLGVCVKLEFNLCKASVNSRSPHFQPRLHPIQHRDPQQGQSQLQRFRRQMAQSQPGGAIGFFRLQNRAAIVKLVELLTQLK